jgi:cob(I)alamin adenosyltransferase
MALNINRIYTRSGDKGLTSLASGERVPKHHPRLESYGTSDELCCLVGRLRTQLAQGATEKCRATTEEMLATIQDRLFDLGTMLATPLGKEWPGMPAVNQADVDQLETWIDLLNADLAPLTSFVLPGGSFLNCDAHLARAVCRRLERVLCGLGELDIEVSPLALAWVNRLSDLLFVLSRWYAWQEGIPEYLWSQRKGS